MSGTRLGSFPQVLSFVPTNSFGAGALILILRNVKYLVLGYIGS